MSKIRGKNGLLLRLLIGGGLLTGSLGTALAFGSPVGAAPGASVGTSTTSGKFADAPPGNNGTIKIGDFDLDNNGNGNEPHIECPFTISYYGFDTGTQTSVITFQAQPPSGTTPVHPTVGPSTTSFQGSGPGDQLDHTDTYQLDVTGLTEQPQQGYHIKVTVDVTGSQGADEKYKTFWYQPCSVPTTTTSTTVPRPTTTTVPRPTTTTVPRPTTTTVPRPTTTTVPRPTTTTVPRPTTTTVPRATTTTAPSAPPTGVSSSGPAAGATTPSPSGAIPIGAPGTGGTPPTTTNVALKILGAVLAVLGGAIAALAAWRRRRIVA